MKRLFAGLPAFHPAGFAAYFVLFLFAQNLREQVSIAAVIAPLALAVIGALVALCLSWLILRDLRLAALATTFSVVVFFTYGHVRTAAEELLLDELLVAAGWLLLFAFGLISVRRLTGISHALTSPLNAVAAILIGLNLAPILGYQFQPGIEVTAHDFSSGLNPGEGNHHPPRDIYVLVFDRYPAERILRDEFDFDNRPFLSELERRGFVIAEDSAANYGKTSLSLASLLDMQYLDMAQLRLRAPSDDDWKPVFDDLRGPMVAPAFLKEQGYRYIHVATWYAATETNVLADQTLVYGGASAFASVLYDTTLLGGLGNLAGGSHKLAWRDLVREHTLFQLGRLDEIGSSPGPKFVFAHLTLPHDPYVFDREGRHLSEMEERDRPNVQNFIEHVEYANQRILRIVDRLLDVPSERQPVILLTSDEGPYPARYAADKDHFPWTQATAEEVSMKYRILNAFHLPGTEGVAPRSSISPVNSLRLILNTYFDTGLPMLPDRAYAFVDERHIYDQFEVTPQLTGDPSRPHAGPLASYELAAPRDWAIGKVHEYHVRVENRGDETWIATGEQPAALGVHFGSESDVPGRHWVTDARFAFSRDVAPGEEIDVPVTVTAPEVGGDYILRHRVLSDAGWSDDIARVPVLVADEIEAWRSALRAVYEPSVPDAWSAGETVNYDVTLTNTGTVSWDHDVRLSVHFGGQSAKPHDGWVTDERFELPGVVPPGDAVTIPVKVTAPPLPRTYQVGHRLVMEGKTWFQDREAVSVTLEAERPALRPSLQLGAVVVVSSLTVLLVAGLAWAMLMRRR